jgi:hypothetical protein
MILLLESLFVAIYSCAIFSTLKYFPLKINILSLIFITGFFKHFIGWITGLQHLYCASKNDENISLNSQRQKHFCLLMHMILLDFLFLI